MADQKKARILIVEDERHIARFLEFVLQKEGFAVDVALDGRVAENKIRAESYAAILLDLGLPDLSGMELLALIRSHPSEPRPVVVVLTAKSSGDVLHQVLEAGADAYCPKPVAPSTLLKKLRELNVNREVSSGEQASSQ